MDQVTARTPDDDEVASFGYRQQFVRSLRHFESFAVAFSFISITTVFTALGVMLGVAALTITLSVMGGLEASLRQRVLAVTPQIEIQSYRGAVTDYTAPGQRAKHRPEGHQKCDQKSERGDQPRDDFRLLGVVVGFPGHFHVELGIRCERILELCKRAGRIEPDVHRLKRVAAIVSRLQHLRVAPDLRFRRPAVRPGPVRPDPVPGVGPASLTLSSATGRRPVGTALDIGTGCGVQSLHLSQHATAVTGARAGLRCAGPARTGAGP